MAYHNYHERTAFALRDGLRTAGGKSDQESRNRGEDIPVVMKKLTPVLEAMPVQPGRDIRETYDLVNNRPQQWYRELGESVQSELAKGFGLVFD